MTLRRQGEELDKSRTLESWEESLDNKDMKVSNLTPMRRLTVTGEIGNQKTYRKKWCRNLTVCKKMEQI